MTSLYRPLRISNVDRYASLTPLPERISRLAELATDLWWSWHREGRDVFRRLDYDIWRATAHNPVRMLWVVPRERLEAAAQQSDFLALYDRAIAALDASHLVGPTPARPRRTDDRVFLRRVRAASVAADLRRRPRRARG